MKTAVLIIWLISGDAITIKQQPGVGCHETFDRITYSKTYTNTKGETRLGRFYEGKEILVYRCI
jgi:hypothetical protein